MIAVTVVYPQQADAGFDFDYYQQQHIPLVQRLLGAALKGVYIERGVAGLGGSRAPAYLAMAHLLFDSVDAFQAAFTPVAAQIEADIARYTQIVPSLQYSEVLLQEARQPALSGWYASPL